MLIKQMQEKRIEAKKSKDKVTDLTLTMLLSRIDRERVNLKAKTLADLTDEQVARIMIKEVSSLRKEQEYFDKETDKYKEVEQSISIIDTFMPETMTEREIEHVLTDLEIIPTDNIGKAMKEARTALDKYVGTEFILVDMSIVAKLIKANFKNGGKN